jgi:type IV pilus assembly protein PilE
MSEMRPNAERAFTLLELAIALAIAGVLAAFAIPSYRGQVARAHRVDATAAVYRAAQFVEAAAPGSIQELPAGFDQAPLSGAAIYKIRLLAADNTNGGYAIEAAPTEAGPMHGDACGTFVLEATGRRWNRGGPVTGATATDDCWSAR